MKHLLIDEGPQQIRKSLDTVFDPEDRRVYSGGKLQPSQHLDIVEFAHGFYNRRRTV